MISFEQIEAEKRHLLTDNNNNNKISFQLITKEEKKNKEMNRWQNSF